MSYVCERARRGGLRGLRACMCCVRRRAHRVAVEARGDEDEVGLESAEPREERAVHLGAEFGAGLFWFFYTCLCVDLGVGLVGWSMDEEGAKERRKGIENERTLAMFSFIFFSERCTAVRGLLLLGGLLVGLGWVAVGLSECG